MPRSPLTAGRPALTTRRFALSRLEWVTTAVAATVSATAYVVEGHPYLARGVVGDLAGLAVLGSVAVARGRRLQHEALLCLVLIGVVVAAAPAWPLRLPELAWWGLFCAGLAAYLVVRRRACD